MSGRAPREDGVAVAYAAVREAVLTGRLPPGQVLSQVQLAADLGIGRGPLREALRRLAAEGLVTGDFNQRMRVSELDLADFNQIYAMRLALEPVGIAATVPIREPGRRGELVAAVEAMDDAVDHLDMGTFRRHHRAFHLGLVADAGPRICAALADLWDHSERYRLSYLHSDDRSGADTQVRLRVSQGEHRDILSAALDGDADRCSAALVAHLRRTLDVVFAEASQVPRIRVGALAPSDVRASAR